MHDFIDQLRSPSVDGRNVPDEPKDTAENCATRCSKIPDCDTFSFDPFEAEGPKCVTYSGGVLEPIDTEGALGSNQRGQISAWCPKGSYWQIVFHFNLFKNLFFQEIQLFMKTPS